MENQDIDLDQILEKLLKLKGTKLSQSLVLSESEVKYLCAKVKQIFSSQPVLLELSAPTKVCGDVFGYYKDLLRIFDLGGFPPETNYLFLGNYVNRGTNSIETICLLFAYKIKYPDKFFLIRGNHECASINRIYGFFDECKRRYNIKMWKAFNDVFNYLPIAAIIDDKIFCVHGGLSPELTSLDQIAEIIRPTEVQETGILCDLLWSDPDSDINGWAESDRGVGYCFGPDQIENFLIAHDLNLICRSHQYCDEGYKLVANGGLVTVFSLSNYRGELDNSGAIMDIDKTLKCSFQLLESLKPKKV